VQERIADSNPDSLLSHSNTHFRTEGDLEPRHIIVARGDHSDDLSTAEPVVIHEEPRAVLDSHSLLPKLVIL